MEELVCSGFGRGLYYSHNLLHALFAPLGEQRRFPSPYLRGTSLLGHSRRFRFDPTCATCHVYFSARPFLPIIVCSLSHQVVSRLQRAELGELGVGELVLKAKALKLAGEILWNIGREEQSVARYLSYLEVVAAVQNHQDASQNER